MARLAAGTKGCACLAHVGVLSPPHPLWQPPTAPCPIQTTPLPTQPSTRSHATRHYRNPAHQRRVRSAWTVAGDCDLLLFLVDASRQLQRPDPRIHRLLAESCSARALGMGEGWSPPPAVLVLNKVDLVPRGARPQLLPLSDHLRKLRSFEDVFYISAKDGALPFLLAVISV